MGRTVDKDIPIDGKSKVKVLGTGYGGRGFKIQDSRFKMQDA
jgi:hypothetical protein